uniref:Uncharacterized protein n=1 Tax=Lygus hesperus TaxID=30085 RepID=A0A0A9WVS6_LYGHE
MIISAFLLLWNVRWSQAQVTPQPIYPEPVVPSIINRPEPVYHPDIPHLFVHWATAIPDKAMYQGHLFAGKAEFPYVVWVVAPMHIYCEDEDTFFLKTPRRMAGSLISWNLVMTACTPLVITVCSENNRSVYPRWPDGEFILDDPSNFNFPLWPTWRLDVKSLLLCPEENVHVEKCDHTQFYIQYATVYLQEDNKYTDIFGHFVADLDNRFSGSRRVVETIIHPLCQPHKSLEFDIGFLYLDAPIIADGTWIGTAPFAASNHMTFDDRNLNDVERNLCYIAGFNELYAGMDWTSSLAISAQYKVKFRTYQTEIGHCMAYAKVICFNRDLPFTRGCWTYMKRIWATMNNPSRRATGIECWETRHQVGAVCAIHSGAPLVCNGYVYGHVIRAADDQRCNVLIPIPFSFKEPSPFILKVSFALSTNNDDHQTNHRLHHLYRRLLTNRFSM